MPPTCQSAHQHLQTQHSAQYVDGETLLSKEGTTQGDHGYVCHRNSAINPSTGPVSKTSVVRRRCHSRRKAAPPIQLVESTSKMWTWIWLSCECIKNMASCQTRAPSPCNWDIRWPWCSNHSWREETSGCSIKAYVKEKVQEWVGEIARLSSIASSQPHAALCSSVWRSLWQMNLLDENSTWHKWLARTTWRSHLSQLPPCSNRKNRAERHGKKSYRITCTSGRSGDMNPTKCASTTTLCK